MTNEERNKIAIDAMKFFKQKLNNGIYGGFVGNFDTAISALKKRIPKKVTHEATLYKCCTCPNCKNVVGEFTEFMGNRCRVTPTYCKYCGQALDWSDIRGVNKMYTTRIDDRRVFDSRIQ